MLYNCKLNLPEPLTPTAFEHLVEKKLNGINTSSNKYLYVDTDISNLNPLLLEIFKSLNLTPSVIKMFGFLDRINWTQTVHIIHSDLVRLNNSWIKHPFAINWELADNEAEFCWWDVGDTPEAYPAVDDVDVNDLISLHARGVHYGHRMNFKIAPHYQIVDKYPLTTSNALAINTGIPHSVVGKINQQPRCGLSIQFPLDQIQTWNKGLELFKDYI